MWGKGNLIQEKGQMTITPEVVGGEVEGPTSRKLLAWVEEKRNARKDDRKEILRHVHRGVVRVGEKPSALWPSKGLCNRRLVKGCAGGVWWSDLR